MTCVTAPGQCDLPSHAFVLKTIYVIQSRRLGSFRIRRTLLILIPTDFAPFFLIVRTRLEIEAPDLAAKLRSSRRANLRAAATAIAKLAVEQLSVQDARIDAGLMAAAAQAWGDSPVRADLQQLTAELDEIAWDIQDHAETGATVEADYEDAFRRARAVAALYFALDIDPANAAAESVYEAIHALDDLDLVYTVVDAALS